MISNFVFIVLMCFFNDVCVFRQSLDFKDLPEYYYYVIIKLVCKCKSEKDKEVVTISDDLKKQMSEQESVSYMSIYACKILVKL